jgi:outer membrane protein OmpA-like peptidoglycan-associated protein
MKYTFKFLPLILILLFSISAFSQDSGPAKMPPGKALKVADYLYSIGSYFNAIDYYQMVLEKEDKNAYAVNQIAQCEFNLRDYKEAEKWFRKLKEMNAADYPLASFMYATALKMNAKYPEAKTEFDKIATSYKGVNSSQIKKQAKVLAEGCALAQTWMAAPDTVKITHLDANINNPYSDFSPMPIGENKLLYSSLKSDKIIMVNEVKKNDKYAEFYVANIVDSTYSQGIEYRDVSTLPKANIHVGNGTFSLDKKRFYYTECKPDDHMRMRCDIFVIENKDGFWTNPAKCSFNDPDSTNTHPAVANSKNGEVIYFSSNRANGEGGLDLYFTVRDKNGVYSLPANLGKKINTTSDDVTPWYDQKNSTLYFSSAGWAGMGGLDIFKSKGAQKKWEPAKNLKYPVNSSVDDMYYVLTDKKFVGYLVSNRPGTISVKSETCCDDIWRVQYPRIIYYAVKGNVYDEETKQVVPGASVQMVQGDTQYGSAISKVDTLYLFDTKPLNSYNLIAGKDGYFKGSASFNVVKTEDGDTIQVDLFIKKIPIGPLVIENIFYDFDKATLRPESFPSLDSLFMVLTNNPSIVVEIRSHTDSKGKDDYNLNLSQRRAESVVKYLLGKGIAAERLKATGMGEIEPIAPNEINGKDNEAGRQLNRRTDFKIIGNIPGKEVIYKQGETGFDENAIDTLEEQKIEEEK